MQLRYGDTIMIIKNSSNVIVYGNDWSLYADKAFSEKQNSVDGSLNLNNATYINIPEPANFVGGHYKYISGDFVLTDIGLDAYRKVSRKKIDVIRYQRSTSNIPFTCAHGSYSFFKNTEEIAELKQAVNDINSESVSFNEVSGGYWRSNENVNVLMTEAEFKDLSRTTTLYVAGLGRESHIQKTAMESATTKAQIDAIVEAYKTYDPLA